MLISTCFIHIRISLYCLRVYLYLHVSSYHLFLAHKYIYPCVHVCTILFLPVPVWIMLFDLFMQMSFNSMSYTLVNLYITSLYRLGRQSPHGQSLGSYFIPALAGQSKKQRHAENGPQGMRHRASTNQSKSICFGKQWISVPVPTFRQSCH